MGIVKGAEAMASIKENRNKDGVVISYRFRACIGRDGAGRQQFATMTVKAPTDLTSKKAEKEMQLQADEWERKLREGKTVPKHYTMKAYIEDVFMPVHVNDGAHKATTTRFYDYINERIIKEFGSREIRLISAVDIERFLNKLRKEELAPRTVAHYRRVLNTEFSFAETHDLIEVSPMRKVSAVKQPPHTVDFLTPEQAQAFIKALDVAPLKWRCLMMVLLNEGLRKGEAIALQWRDIDFQASTLTVERSAEYIPKKGVVIDTPKSKTSLRTLPVPERVIGLLKEWKVEQERSFSVKLMPTAYVFSRDENPYVTLHPCSPTEWLRQFEKNNNLPDMSPHDLRHTCGSLMLMSGASIKDTQSFLGHSNAQTTLAFYTGSTPDSLRNASDILAKALEI